MFLNHPYPRRGHTLLELVVALIATALLLAGLGSVMLIARQIAYTPSAATHRLEASKIVNQLGEELSLATFITQRSANLLEFVVADRDGDGADERIRYEWSGTPGDPLQRSYNGADPVTVLGSVQDFNLEYTTEDVTSSIETTTDSAEVLLQSNETLQTNTLRGITLNNWSAQQIDPAAFVSAAPANALYWNATRADFQGASSGFTSGTLYVRLCSTGTPYNEPTSQELAEAVIPESSLSSSLSWRSAQFASAAQKLPLHRNYALVWSTNDASGTAANLRTDTISPSTYAISSTGVLESSDGGASWQYVLPGKQIYYRLYGTYTTPGPTYDVTRKYLSNVGVQLQTGLQTHSRVDASIALANLPELLSAYWRTDFDTDPTTCDVNGDGTADWLATTADEIAGAVTYDASSVSGGTWHAEGKLRTQPLNDFSNITTVDVRLRDTSVGGSGAVAWINADWGNGQAASIAFGVIEDANGTQSFRLIGQTSDSTEVVLFQQDNLTDELVHCRLTILPEHDLVNVQINGTDVGTFTYPTYAIASNDRFVSVCGDTDTAEFDYVEVRVSESN